jgi:hypothetical protein
MDTEAASLNNPTSAHSSCCICGRQVDKTKSIIEERPTGDLWHLEKWFYCLDCWLSMKKLRKRKISHENLLRVLDL